MFGTQSLSAYFHVTINTVGGELWLVWLSGMSAGLQTKRSRVPFSLKAHAWIVGQAPGGGHVTGNHTLMFLSLSFSLPSLLSKNLFKKITL